MKKLATFDVAKYKLVLHKEHKGTGAQEHKIPYSFSFCLITFAFDKTGYVLYGINWLCFHRVPDLRISP